MPASGTSSLQNQPTLPPRPNAEFQITLIDHTAAPRISDVVGGDVLDDAQLLERIPSDLALGRKWTTTSLRQQLAGRKYNRYEHEREERLPEAIAPSPASDADRERGRLHRGKAKAMGFWKRKRLRQMQEEDAVIDVLYENQRGSFFFGFPLFSSNSLLNFDPKAWINAHMKPSPVNITNAQVPDPNWEWAWKSWYVDMSRDVDEEGWEYSFSFQNGFAWHGSHPWFHSFVRRRRWLRKRIRKHTHHAVGMTPAQRRLAEAHLLNSDYFTIHPYKDTSVMSSKPGSLAASSAGRLKAMEDDREDMADIRDIASLLKFLRRAAVDREKLVLVRKFIEHAEDDLFYLAEQMPTIMALFVFQNSRRRLHTILMEHFDAATKHRQEHEDHEEEETALEKQKIDNILKAVHAADEQVKKLEYWSDIRGVARKGDTITAVNDSVQWPSHEWQGLDTSGPNANFTSDAKEKGKTRQEVHDDAQVQDVDPLDRASSNELPGLSRSETDASTEQLLQPPGEEEYTTAQENGRPDKGKARAEE